jgi:Uma2 family endonuclease
MDIAPPQSEVTWPIPPEDGYFAEDLDTIPDLPPHTELIDGSLVFVRPQVVFHKRAMLFLWRQLAGAAPPEFAVHTEMTVTLGPKQRPEPDVLITWATAEKSNDQSDFEPADVLLVAEIVSNESRVRDRERKPQLYAAAGIKIFWRIENVDGKPVVYAYELDPATKQYVATGVHRDRLIADWPFAIDLDLTGIALPEK